MSLNINNTLEHLLVLANKYYCKDSVREMIIESAAVIDDYISLDLPSRYNKAKRWRSKSISDSIRNELEFIEACKIYRSNRIPLDRIHWVPEVRKYITMSLKELQEIYSVARDIYEIMAYDAVVSYTKSYGNLFCDHQEWAEVPPPVERSSTEDSYDEFSDYDEDYDPIYYDPKEDEDYDPHEDYESSELSEDDDYDPYEDYDYDYAPEDEYA
jgi:hypothetical protein